MKRIVVGLDGSRFSETATRASCQLAASCKGTVVGIGIIDMPGIEWGERGAPPGASYFAEKAEEHKIQDALRRITQFLQKFEEKCREYGVKYELHSDEGVPFEAIVESGKIADLITIGLRTFYHFETSSKPGDTLKRVLQHSVCPVLAVPEKMERVENVLVAYDGSTESAKALRAFVNLFQPLLGQLHVTLLTISEKRGKTETVQKEALDYLKCWDIQADAEVMGGKVYQAVIERAKAMNHPLAVMGAFGRNPISDLFFGSTARRVVEDSTIPVLVYH